MFRTMQSASLLHSDTFVLSLLIHICFLPSICMFNVKVLHNTDAYATQPAQTISDNGMADFRRKGYCQFMSRGGQDEALVDQDAFPDDEDFKAWADNLKQWPLIPTSDAEQISNETVRDYSIGQQFNETSGVVASEASFLRSPLSRVFSIETLLKLTLQQSTNAQDDTDYLPSAMENASTTVTPEYNISVFEELGVWGKWLPGGKAIGKSAEVLLKQATTSIEALITEATAVVSTDTIETLIRKSSETVTNMTALELLENAKLIAIDRGLNVSDATAQAKETTAFANSLLRTADGVFRNGYVTGDPVASKQKTEKQNLLKDVPAIAGSRALFDGFESVAELNEFSLELAKASEMGILAGAVYEESATEEAHAIRQTIVAKGVTNDVAWMVTDAISNNTSFSSRHDSIDKIESAYLVRTITIRGYDASDESVDRELLLNRICTAEPEPFDSVSGVLVHSGLFGIARGIFKDVKQYIEWTAPTHKIVLNGHSIGGSLSLLLLLLIVQEYGADFAREKVVQVFCFGSPPVTVVESPGRALEDAFDLPSTMIQGYVQPWDPIVRLFSTVDALYPLVGDLGPDDTTPFADGPPRALRPILKTILESWDGWPRFRENFRGTANQTYTNVGVQHILLPEPTRYLADRFIAVTIQVPPVETLLRLSSEDLYPALASTFPLDVFEVSFVPQAVRSFVHHFYPAYGNPLRDYVKELKKSNHLSHDTTNESMQDERQEKNFTLARGRDAENRIDWGKATQWLTDNRK